MQKWCLLNQVSKAHWIWCQEASLMEGNICSLPPEKASASPMGELIPAPVISLKWVHFDPWMADYSRKLGFSCCHYHQTCPLFRPDLPTPDLSHHFIQPPPKKRPSSRWGEVRYLCWWPFSDLLLQMQEGSISPAVCNPACCWNAFCDCCKALYAGGILISPMGAAQ